MVAFMFFLCKNMFKNLKTMLCVFLGFLYIVNPFLPFFDRIWAKRCLKDYSCKPNRCNLDVHETLETSLWHRCIK